MWEETRSELIIVHEQKKIEYNVESLHMQKEALLNMLRRKIQKENSSEIE